MKFWRHLSELLEAIIPEWRDKFLSYKDLKKEINRAYPKDETNNGDDIGGDLDARPSKRLRLNDENGNTTEGHDYFDGGDGGDDAVVEEEEMIDFEKLLEREIDKLNDFFLEKEEFYIMKLEALRDRVEDAMNSTEEMMKVGRDMADFHGEMVLLESYSALNYLGILKILKKYDKRSGALMRLPFIQRVRQEPFCKTDILDNLVNECDTILTERFNRVPEENAERQNTENMYVRLASAALLALERIRSRSSTPNEFSLPPM